MQPLNRRQWLALTGAAAALAGCGFRLRGTGTGQQQYPFRSLYISGAATAMVKEIKYNGRLKLTKRDFA